MPKALDLTGQRFGSLVAVSDVGVKEGLRIWLCQCDCGGTRISSAKYLKRGHATNCGAKCAARKPRGKAHNHKDLTGMVFSRLTVIKEVEPAVFPSGTKTQFLCRCECGTELTVLGASLTTGNSKSCGCWALKVSSDRFRTHSQTGTRVHRAWQAMLNRCRYPYMKGYENYGGRGITVCERWNTFENFLEDMGHPPAGCTLDRIDNNGNYEPSNCRWATRAEQSRNKRNNRVITFNGETLCLVDWAKRIGIDQTSLAERLEKWPVDVALTKPKYHQGA